MRIQIPGIRIKTICNTLIMGICTMMVQAQNSLPAVSKGTLERIPDFKSQYITSRHIDIWLPPGYSTNQQYAVLYMQDGQMLYDPESTWNKQAWDIDDVAAGLQAGGQTMPFIIVGIWNGVQTRHHDYYPEKPYQSLSPVEKDTAVAQLIRAHKISEGPFIPHSDAYLKFLVQELKPLIDQKYSVYRDRAHTFIAGSSMGGLVSIYAICEYPQIFGGAACLSTHWTGSWTNPFNPFPAAMQQYLRQHLPNQKKHRIYFDYGNQTLDSLYGVHQQKVDILMKEKGYSNKNWLTRYFPGEDHSEAAWKRRAEIPLQFLLRKD